MAVLAAETGLLVAAEGHGLIHVTVAVHPDRSRAHLWYQAMDGTDVPAPDAGCQAVRGVIGHGRNLLQVIEALCHQHRSKDLLAHHRHVRAYIGNDRGLHVIAVALRRLPARHDLGAALAPRLDVAEHAVLLLLGDQRSHLGLGVQARSEANPCGGLTDTLHDLIEHFTVGIQAVSYTH